MNDETTHARRRIVLAVIVFVMLLIGILPGPRAKLELTTARVSVLLETGPLRFQAMFTDSAEAIRPTGLILSVGGFTR